MKSVFIFAENPPSVMLSDPLALKTKRTLLPTSTCPSVVTYPYLLGVKSVHPVQSAWYLPVSLVRQCSMSYVIGNTSLDQPKNNSELRYSMHNALRKSKKSIMCTGRLEGRLAGRISIWPTTFDHSHLDHETGPAEGLNNGHNWSNNARRSSTVGWPTWMFQILNSLRIQAQPVRLARP